MGRILLNCSLMVLGALASGALQAETEATGRIAVRILNPKGESTEAGVHVALRATEPEAPYAPRPTSKSEGSHDERLVTDAQGRASFTVPAGVRYQLRVWRGEEEKHLTHRPVPALAPGEQRAIDVALHRNNATAFCAQVVSAATGFPIEGARVQNHSPERDEEPFHATTGPDGAFEIHVTGRNSQVHGVVRASGFAPAFFDTDLEHELPSAAERIALWPGAALDGRVEAAPGVGLEDLTVRVSMEHWPEAWSEVFPVEADGRFSAEDLPILDPLRLTVLRGGAPCFDELHPVTLQPGERVSRTVRIGFEARIEGRLVGAPEGMLHSVWLVGADRNRPKYFYDNEKVYARASTDEQGRFHFASVPPGTYWIGPENTGLHVKQDPDKVLAPMARVVRVEERERFQLELPVHCGLFISGLVVDPDGAPIGDVEVDAVQDGVWGGALTRSSYAGHFRLGPLGPGPWKVTTWTATTKGFAGAEPMLASPGDDEVVLRLRYPSRITIRLVDETTGESLDGSVRIRPSADTWSDTLNGVAVEDAVGLYTCEKLAPGFYDLVGRAKNLVGILRSVRLGEGDDLEVELGAQQAARLELVYSGTTTAHYWITAGGTAVGSGQLLQNESKSLTVPPGTLDVLLSDGIHDIAGYVVEASVDMPAKLVVP